MLKEVKTEFVLGISFDEMKTGDIGVVMQWPGLPEMIGCIVFRGQLGRWLNLSNGQCWTPNGDKWDNDSLRVRLLPKGTLLEVIA